jgi:preprotein translocase subunit YajC
MVRRIWGILFLLSLAWMGYGLLVTAQATDTAMESAAQRQAGMSEEERELAEAGTTIGVGFGAGLSLTTFFCTGAPFALLFGVLYFRAGDRQQRDKQHKEMLAAVRDSSDMPVNARDMSGGTHGKTERILAEAKGYLQAKEWDRARQTLKPIRKHPTAAKWLSQLEERGL